jgi:hypothetical protein
MNGTAAGGVAIRDSSLVTTAERNALREREQVKARRQRARGMQKRLDEIEHQIHNAARRRLEAWREGGSRETAVEHITEPLGARLSALYEEKRRLVDPRWWY